MPERKTSPWQDYLDAGLGFSNHWYPAFFSHELREADASEGNGEPVEHFSGPCGVRLIRGAGTPVWEVDVADGKSISAQYLPDEPGVMQGMIPEVGIWMPGVLRVDPFPAPHIVHFEWYVPVNERTHRYMISWGSKVRNEQEEKAFFDEMKYLWRDFVPQKFNNEDMFAREAMDDFYSAEGGWHRERLFGPDVLITAWRMLCSRTNRGIQHLPYGAQRATKAASA